MHDQVTHFYDTHPITAAQVLAKIGETGGDPESLTPPDLFDHDQDHYGHLAANDALIEAAGIASNSQVLDICAGIGGPARYVAWKSGAEVTGVDLTESRCHGARELSGRVGLAGATRFSCGDAQSLPFATGVFDAVISQEAWLHVPDKPALLGEAARVLRPGGRLAFTDWIAGPGFDDPDRKMMARAFAAVTVPVPDAYRQMLETAGFRDIAVTDLSAARVPVLQERLAMYERLRAETLARTGEDRDRDYCEHYARFVHLAEIGAIGGARFSGVQRTGETPV